MLALIRRIFKSAKTRQVAAHRLFWKPPLRRQKLRGCAFTGDGACGALCAVWVGAALVSQTSPLNLAADVNQRGWEQPGDSLGQSPECKHGDTQHDLAWIMFRWLWNTHLRKSSLCSSESQRGRYVWSTSERGLFWGGGAMVMGMGIVRENAARRGPWAVL